MNFTRKICLTVCAAILGVGAAGFAAPAQAMDSSWGCGGMCIVKGGATK